MSENVRVSSPRGLKGVILGIGLNLIVADGLYLAINSSEMERSDWVVGVLLGISAIVCYIVGSHMRTKLADDE